MPLPKLAKLKKNLSAEFTQAVDHARIEALYKLAWQANRRFWEEALSDILAASASPTARSRRCDTPPMAT